jgi:hypothetical protein
LFNKFIASFISRISRGKWFFLKPLRYFGLDNLKYLKNKKIDERFLLVAFYSGLLGGVSHLLLDLPTHSNIVLFYPWIVILTPALIKNVILNLGTISIFIFNLPLNFLLQEDYGIFF